MGVTSASTASTSFCSYLNMYISYKNATICLFLLSVSHFFVYVHLHVQNKIKFKYLQPFCIHKLLFIIVKVCGGGASETWNYLKYERCSLWARRLHYLEATAEGDCDPNAVFIERDEASWSRSVYHSCYWQKKNLNRCHKLTFSSKKQQVAHVLHICCICCLGCKMHTRTCVSAQTTLSLRLHGDLDRV